MMSSYICATIVAACRSMMPAGRLRPTMRACCGRAGWSGHTGHRAFGPVAALHRAAIDDVATRHAIRILGAEPGALGTEHRPASGEKRHAGLTRRPFAHRRAANQADFAGSDVDREAIKRLATRRVSPTSSEARASCPTRWLQRNTLRVEAAKPEFYVLMGEVAMLRGAPKPTEFRKFVQGGLGERHRRLRRCRSMPEALSGSRDVFWRIGNIAKAAHYGRLLVVAETLAPEASAAESGSAP